MAWGNVRLSGGEEPHAYGIEVELWKRDGEVYGFISEFVGPPADAPAGRLDDVMFDEKTGALSFVAKLSVGVVLSEDGTAWLPAKNEYAFTGVVDRKTMKGSLQRRTVHPDRSISTEEESLTLDRNDSAETGEKVPVYEEWLESWEAILQARGPRW